MAYWDWQDTYLTNISELDEHHKKLSILVNTLYDNIMQCQNMQERQPIIDKALSDLIDYSYYHFAAEEKLMLLHDYPGYEQHKEEHEAFRKKVTEFIKQYHNGILAGAFPICEFLKTWIDLHILKTDKLYAPYLNSKNIT